jgi:hypothetical protein
MRRYVTRPTAQWWEDAKGSDHLARTVHEQDRSPRDTGLLDAGGQKLFAVDAMDPIGFVRKFQ